MTTLRDRIAEIFDFNDRFTEGYEKGVEDTLTALREFVTERSAVAARRGAPPASAAFRTNDAKADRGGNGSVSRRRGLTPTQKRTLLVITENAGLSFGELKSRHGVLSPSTVYDLVCRRKVRRVEEPKPWKNDEPHVRFYPM